eukprot:m.88975 g.88975  ORF g.88975 m.88975 type:complete len:456 (+) comp18099_c0_seq2:662-2029(+)
MPIRHPLLHLHLHPSPQNPNSSNSNPLPVASSNLVPVSGASMFPDISLQLLFSNFELVRAAKAAAGSPTESDTPAQPPPAFRMKKSASTSKLSFEEARRRSQLLEQEEASARQAAAESDQSKSPEPSLPKVKTRSHPSFCTVHPLDTSRPAGSVEESGRNSTNWDDLTAVKALNSTKPRTPYRKSSPPKPKEVKPLVFGFVAPPPTKKVEDVESTLVRRLSTGIALDSSPPEKPPGQPLKEVTMQVPEDDVGQTADLELSFAALASGKGTIRGKKNGVRKQLEVMAGKKQYSSSDILSRLYEEERKGKIVLYTTTVKAVRETHSVCEEVRRILYNMRLKVIIRDISMDSATVKELEQRLPGATVPQVFVNGEYFGDAQKIRSLNETGELKKLLGGFEIRPTQDCTQCGGAGFVPCTWCQGSKKSIHNPFEREDITKRALKCTVCNEIGLQRCELC